MSDELRKCNNCSILFKHNTWWYQCPICSGRYVDYDMHKGESLSKERIIKDFELDKNALDNKDILFASLFRDGYSGAALVIFKDHGKLFGVWGGHNSCDGLEGQWDPEEMTWPLLNRIYTKNKDMLSILKDLEARG